MKFMIFVIFYNINIKKSCTVLKSFDKENKDIFSDFV